MVSHSETLLYKTSGHQSYSVKKTLKNATNSSSDSGESTIRMNRSSICNTPENTQAAFALYFSLHQSKSENTFKSFQNGRDDICHVSLDTLPCNKYYVQPVVNHCLSENCIGKDEEAASLATNAAAFSNGMTCNVATVCETVSTQSRPLPGSIDEISKSIKETTFSDKLFTSYRKPNTAPGRPIKITSSTNNKQLLKEKECNAFDSAALEEQALITDCSKNFGNWRDQFFLNPNETWPRICNKNFTIVNATKHPTCNLNSDFHPNEPELNPLVNNKSFPSPTQSLATFQEKEGYYTVLNNIRTQHRRKGLKRNSRTRKAQRRKRMPRIVRNSKARRNSAILAKVSFYVALLQFLSFVT